MRDAQIKESWKQCSRKKNYEIGITNGGGSNIVGHAARWHQDRIKILVLVDSDSDGKSYKASIIKKGGIYSKKSVFTLRDLVGNMISGGTIEDLLGKGFVEAKFKGFYKSKLDEDVQIFFN